jgi:membrane protease YdiL (CAAX protease family)
MRQFYAGLDARWRTLIAIACVLVAPFFTGRIVPWERIPIDGYWIGIMAHIYNVVISMALIKIFCPEFKVSRKLKSKSAAMFAVALVFVVVKLPSLVYTASFHPRLFDYAAGFLFTFFIGLDEEIEARHLHFGILQRHGFYFGVFSSSFIFGLAHISNYFYGHQAWQDTLEQMVSAAGFGVLCCGLYLITGRLIVPIIFHGLHDMTLAVNENVAPEVSAFNGSHWGDTLAFTTIYLSIGLALIYLSQKNTQRSVIVKPVAVLT